MPLYIHHNNMPSVYALAEAAQSVLGARRMLVTEAAAQTRMGQSALADMLDGQIRMLETALSEIHGSALKGADLRDDDDRLAIARVERCAALAQW